MHTPDAIQQILSEIANWNLKNVKIWGTDEGVLPPMTPVNPYLGGNVRKKWATFYCLFIYAHFGNLILELNMVPGVLLEPYMSQGDQGVAETPIVSKGLTLRKPKQNVRAVFLGQSGADWHVNPGRQLIFYSLCEKVITFFN